MQRSILGSDFLTMDLSLWDPPICEDESFEFGGNIAENWLRSDFYYGYGLWDVIEEDALNEKACMEVLRRKAKTDIEEVEEEITMLRRPLDLADVVWSKKHSNLKERIHSLSVLILGLKNEEQHTENALDFQNLGEYAEKLAVMSRNLLGSYSPNKDSQNSGLATEKLQPTQSEEVTKISCETKIAEETAGSFVTADVKEEDKAIEETLEDDVHDKGEKTVSLTEKEFPVSSLVAPEPTLAMEMEHAIPLLKHLKRKFPCGQVGKHSGYKKNSKENDVNKGGKSNIAASDVNLDPVSQPSGKKRKCHIPASDINLDPVSEPLGKKMKCQSSPLLKKNLEKINQDTAKMNEDMPSQLIKEDVENICSTALIEIPSSSTFKSLSMVQLRAIAKERKLKGVSKTKKNDLIKALQDQEKQLDQASP